MYLALACKETVELSAVYPVKEGLLIELRKKNDDPARNTEQETATFCPGKKSSLFAPLSFLIIQEI